MILKRQVALLASDGPKPIAVAKSVVVCNLGFYSVFVGDGSVTPVGGFELQAGKSYSFELGVNQPLYGVVVTDGSVLVLEDVPVSQSEVPINIDLAGSLGGEITFVHAATPVTSVAQLPTNPPVGSLAQLTIGQWPAVEVIDLVCYADPVSGLKYWVSGAQSLITQSDQNYMGVNTNGDSYIGTNNAGGTTGSIGWTTRSIRRASEILATGLKLQANLTAILSGSTIPAVFSLEGYFFQHNNGDQVIFSADGSARDAELSGILLSNADNLPRFKSTGWLDVVKKGTSTPIDATAIVKTNLWPRLYGKVASGASYGSEIDADMQYRWYIQAS